MEDKYHRIRYYLSTKNMDQATLEIIKQQLLERRRSLGVELKDVTGNVTDASGESQASFPDYGNDDDENSAEVETFTTNLSLEKVFASSLRDIDSALERIANGTYGTCKYCGQPIDERRLLARPASSSCISCKEERKNRT